MDRIWLKHYPPGVPADIDPGRYASLVDLLEESFANFADRDAFICMGKSITYRRFDELSAHLAAYLQSTNLKKGARVAVMMPNVLQHPIASSAILRAGYTVVNVNPLYAPRELEHQLKDSGAEAIVVLENFAHTFAKVQSVTAVKHVIIAAMGDLLGLKGVVVNAVVRHVKKMVPPFSLPGAVTFNAALTRGRTLPLSKPALGPDDIAFLQYTGGTTGVAKGATLLHRNIIANMLQNDAWLQPALNEPPRDDTQFLTVCALPLYHIFALTACFLLAVRAGGANLLIPNPRDMKGFVKELSKYRVNNFPGVNTLYNGLLNTPGFEALDFSRLKCSPAGGMAVQRPVAERWQAVTGCAITEGYGLSETSPVLTCNPPDGTFNGSIGLPVPSTYISIRDDDNIEVPLGVSGEICAKGPQVMPGYWNNPEETAQVMTPDGYFRTGDIGVMSSEGYIRIVDRKKDMILVSGFNVYPNEVEEVIAGHPGVLECAVIGVPDGKSMESVKAFVVKKDASLTAPELIAFASERLSRYKVPKHIEFRTDLPKTNVGKILRRALRDETPLN